MSTVFSVRAFRISFNGRSVILVAATRFVSNVATPVFRCLSALTFFCNDINYCILIDESHTLYSPFTDASHCIGAPNASFSTGCCIQQRALKVSIQFRIEFTVIAEHDADRFVSVYHTKLEIGAKSMLQEIAVVRRDL